MMKWWLMKLKLKTMQNTKDNMLSAQPLHRLMLMLSRLKKSLIM